MNYRQDFIPEVYDHIYNRTVGNEMPFHDSNEAYYFLERVNHLLVPYLDFYAYAIMGNRFHFIGGMRKKHGSDPPYRISNQPF